MELLRYLKEIDVNVLGIVIIAVMMVLRNSKIKVTISKWNITISYDGSKNARIDE